MSLAYHLAMLVVGQASSAFDVIVLRMLPTFFLTVLAFVPFAYIYSHGGGSGLDLGRKSARGSHAKHGSKYSLGKL